MQIKPEEHVKIGEELEKGTSMIVKNDGPARIGVATGYGFGDKYGVEILPGHAKAFRVRYDVIVTCLEPKPALIAFDIR